MPHQDLISIIIPSYNRENTIERAIKSVFEQTYSNLEIIIVDDFSTDNSIAKIKTLIKDESRIKLLLNKQNQGPNFTRNRGIQAAQGKYLSLLDSDDEWIPETIEILWNKLKNTPDNIGLVYAGLTIISNTSSRKIYPKYRGMVFRDLLTRGVIGVYPLIKRTVFDKVGLFDEHEILRKGGAQDYEMWIRIAQYYEFEYSNKLILNKYDYQDSITYETLVKNPIKKIRTYLYIWKKYHPYFGDDSGIYIFFCYKIFELLCGGNYRELARKTIFMAFKKNYLKPRTYFHLIFYLHDFHSPIKFLGKIEQLARYAKEILERFRFRFRR
jgi:glycosyltransferase involved in cell wall biosynthesis